MQNQPWSDLVLAVSGFGQTDLVRNQAGVHGSSGPLLVSASQRSGTDVNRIRQVYWIHFLSFYSHRQIRDKELVCRKRRRRNFRSLFCVVCHCLFCVVCHCFVWYIIVLYGISLFCVVFVWYIIVLCGISLFCVVLCGISLFCVVYHCFVWYIIALCGISVGLETKISSLQFGEIAHTRVQQQQQQQQ